MNSVKNHLDQVILELSKLIPLEFIKENLFIAGGSIRSLVSGEEPQDYDFFMKSDVASQIREYLKDVMKYESDNSIGTYVQEAVTSHSGLTYLKNKEIQIIICAKGTPKDIIGEFDFRNNMNYYDISTGELVIDEYASNKQLKINPMARNLVGTLARVSKFVEKRGFRVPSIEDMTILAIRLTNSEPIESLSELKDASRLRDCLTEKVIESTGIKPDIELYSAQRASHGSTI